MKDIELLKSITLPNDELIAYFRSNKNISPYVKIHKFRPFTSYVTLGLVEAFRKTAHEYIVQLLRNKEKYGFLYDLHSRKMVVPLHLQFNGELVIDPIHRNAISCAIDDLAREIVSAETALFLITKVELLYFYTLFVNVHLNYATVDHALGCNKTHGYLVAQRMLSV